MLYVTAYYTCRLVYMMQQGPSVTTILSKMGSKLSLKAADRAQTGTILLLNVGPHEPQMTSWPPEQRHFP